MLVEKSYKTVKEVLRNCEIFSRLGNTELEKLASSAIEKQYESGTTMFHEGDNAEELFVIQEGRVAIQITLPMVEGQISRRVTVDVITRNDVLGWSVIVEPYKYTFTGICLQKVKALSISGNKFRWLLQDNTKIGYEVLNGLIKVVASRLDDTRRVLVSERLLTHST